MMRWGWKPETVDPPRMLAITQWSRLQLQGVSPPEASLVEAIPSAYMRVLDQGGTGSCVAQSIARGIQLEGQLAGDLDYPLPSRRWLYRLARETHHDGDVDGGTYISAGLHVGAVLGWPSEAHVPWSERDVNEPMTATARHHAHDQTASVETAPIIAWGTMREEQIRSAVGIGRHPIVFGAIVDTAYIGVVDWELQELDGPAAGGHAQLIVGYDEDGVHVLNSWGPDWGCGGMARLSWKCARTMIRDLHVIRKVERPST